VIELARVAGFIAVLGTAIVFGTDAFCALVLRPALAHVDDRCLVAVTGYVHQYGDRRMPVPGVLGIVGAAASATLAAVAGQWSAAAAAGTAVGVLLIWLVLYVRVSAPINRQLTAAAKAGEVPPNARVLQRNWDRIITARAVLQGLATAAMCVALMI
jgi:predicted lysophospholipase L1 biosynthesis ABC-type transport system permease subunit